MGVFALDAVPDALPGVAEFPEEQPLDIDQLLPPPELRKNVGKIDGHAAANQRWAAEPQQITLHGDFPGFVGKPAGIRQACGSIFLPIAFPI